jgi:hypothetical protein
MWRPAVMQICPLVQERAPGAGADGRIHINVVEYDESVIPAELQVCALQQPACGFADPATNARGAGERDDTDVGMLDEGHPDIGPARQYPEQPFR